MSERIDQFSDSLRQRLTTIEKMIDEAKIGLKGAKGSDSNELHSELQSVRHKFEAAKHVAKTVESRMTKWLRAREASDTSVVQGWKDDVRVASLNIRLPARRTTPKPVSIWLRPQLSTR